MSFFNSTGTDIVTSSVSSALSGRAIAVMNNGNVLQLLHPGDDSQRYLSLQMSTGGTAQPVLKNTISLTGSAQSRVPYSMAIAPDNDIFIAYVLGGNQVQMKRYNYSSSGGGTWTLAATETVLNASGDVWRVDIDLMNTTGTSMVVAITQVMGPAVVLTTCLRRTTGAWVVNTDVLDNTILPGMGSSSGQTNTDPKWGILSVAADTAAPVSNAKKFLVMVGAGFGCPTTILGFNVNVSTGAYTESKTLVEEAFNNQFAAPGKGHLFSVGSNQWIAAAIFEAGNAGKLHMGQLNWDGYTIPNSTRHIRGSVTPASNFLLRPRGMACGGSTDKRVAFFYENKDWDNFNLRVMVGRVVDNSKIEWTPEGMSAQVVSLGTTGASPRVAEVLDGANLNFNQFKFPVGYNVWESPTASSGVNYYSCALPPTLSTLTKNPKASAVVNTNMPILGAQYGGTIGVDLPVKFMFELAQNLAFTSGLRQFLMAGPYGSPSAYAEQRLPVANKIAPGSWFYRARAQNELGLTQVASGSTPHVIWSVSHPAQALPLAPGKVNNSDSSSASEIAYAPTYTFRWIFLDTSSDNTQYAYRIIIKRVDTGAQIYSSGKVVSSAGTAEIALSASYNGLQLQWTVEVWDNHDTTPLTPSPPSLFRIVQAPTVNITGGSTYTSPSPLIDWTYTAGTEGAQVKSRVLLVDIADNSVAYDSGIVANALSQWQVPANKLLNGHIYETTVWGYDQRDLSDLDIEPTRTATWVPPVQPALTVDPNFYNLNGHVRLSWTDSVQASGWVAYRAYRRIQGESTWEQIGEIVQSLPEMSILDYKGANGVVNEYLLTQVRLVSGSLIESDFTTFVQVTPTADKYWIIEQDLQGITLNQFINGTDFIAFKLQHVTSDEFNDEYEEEIVILPGRGRKRNVGAKIGYAGQLTAELKGMGSSTAAEERVILERAREQNRDLWLRDPFGNTYNVVLGQLSFSRIAGVGTEPYMTVTIPYTEVM